MLNNERITVPEILFHPSDAGISQVGLADAVLESILSADPLLHASLFANILVTGGCAAMPGFRERLYVLYLHAKTN